MVERKDVDKVDAELLDRVEFALRDAGFDYDEAFRLAFKAASYREGEPTP